MGAAGAWFICVLWVEGIHSFWPFAVRRNEQPGKGGSLGLCLPEIHVLSVLLPDEGEVQPCVCCFLPLLLLPPSWEPQISHIPALWGEFHIQPGHVLEPEHLADPC